MADDVNASALHVDIVVVGVRVSAVPIATEKGPWVDPLQDLSGRPAM